MKIEKYSDLELQVRKAKTELKLMESKESLKTIRDVSELRTLDPKYDSSEVGKNVDLYI